MDRWRGPRGAATQCPARPRRAWAGPSCGQRPPRGARRGEAAREAEGGAARRDGLLIPGSGHFRIRMLPSDDCAKTLGPTAGGLLRSRPAIEEVSYGLTPGQRRRRPPSVPA
ncbi:hypothetical protein ACFPRL_30320 [Pseudoclavibacter helvolus]